MTERRSTDTYVKRRVRLLAIAWCFLGIAVVGGYFSQQRIIDKANEDRAEQTAAITRQVKRIDDLTMRLHDTGCANFDTLHRLIGKQRLNRPALRLLGFTDAQIAGAAREVQKQKDKTLALLGERDPTCPPVKEKP